MPKFTTRAESARPFRFLVLITCASSSLAFTVPTERETAAARSAWTARNLTPATEAEARAAAAAEAAEAERVARGFRKAPASATGAPAVIAPQPVVARGAVSVEAFSPLARGVRAVWRAIAPDRFALGSTASASDAVNALAVAEAVTAPARASAALSFKERQLTLPRVRLAYRRTGAVIDSVLTAHQILDRVELHIRVYKQDRVVELWGRRSSGLPFVKLREYEICEISGRPGPKRREGDTQVPEGFYTIDALNATSSYHLSLHIDYPNAADRRRPGRARRLGGQIFIHGGCASIGCIAITDRNIEELYAFIVEARDSGQRKIPIAIFPIRMDQDGLAWLSGSYGTDSPDYSFWMNLKRGYDYFEQTRRLPSIDVTSTGDYQFGPLSTS